MSVHESVLNLVDDYLALVDAAAPGLIEGLYLTGSVALDDYRPGISDIDFVAVTENVCAPESLAALGKVHADLSARHRRPFFDGSYVTWDQLAHDPAAAPPGPQTHEHRFTMRAGGLDPVTWQTLADCGVTMRGPARLSLPVWTDRATLAAWTHNNLETYWRGWQQRSSFLPSPLGLAALGAWSPTWMVLGVSRLHYTLATGKITSKQGAGLYALATFPDRWHPVVNECLRIRNGAKGRSLYGNPMRRRRDALDFTAMVIDGALKLY